MCKPDGTMELCESGFYCDGVKPEKQKCPAGQKCPDGKTMVACPSGWYSAENSASCTICPAGSRCPNTNHGPITCSPGTY